MSVAMKEEYNEEWSTKKDLIKRTICKGSSDEELELFLYTCKRTGLDPLMKQAYAVKRWSSSDKREVMTIQTSIDGYRLIADRTGRYSPGREATIEENEDGTIKSATAYIKKMTPDGTWHEISSTAYFEEYAGKTKEGDLTKFWKSMPRLMLAKCAESLALRKAFPAELSGIYTTDEMHNAVSSSEEEAKPEKKVEQQFDIGYFADELEKRTGETISHLALEAFVNTFAQERKSTPVKIMQRALESQKFTDMFMDAYRHDLEGNSIPI